MYQTKQESLYETIGKVRANRRENLTHICLKDGGLVVYVPDAKCISCGDLLPSEVVRVPESLASEVRAEIAEQAKAVQIAADWREQMNEFVALVTKAMKVAQDAIDAEADWLDEMATRESVMP